MTNDSDAAPSVVFRKPPGHNLVGTFYMQGLIVDPRSPSGRLAVTNGILVESR